MFEPKYHFYDLLYAPNSKDQEYWHGISKRDVGFGSNIHIFDHTAMTYQSIKRKAGSYKEHRRGVRSVDPTKRPENWKRKRV